MGSPSTIDDPSASAAEILRAMAAAYRGCATYADTGEVRTTLVGADRTRTTVRPFATAFERGTGRFRFEYRERWWGDAVEQRYIVWRGRGAGVRTWWDLDGAVGEKTSLGSALAGATGVSGGSAHTVPELLTGDEVGGRSLGDLADAAERMADEVVDGGACYCVAGAIPMPGGDADRISVLIDRRTLLVRRIIVRGALDAGGVEVESVTSYHARIDEAVSDVAFEFGVATGDGA